MRAADAAAKLQGLKTRIHEAYLQGDAIERGHYIAHTLQAQPDVLHIWGGETTIRLPENPGTGGRCQSLALSAAITMRGYENWYLLAAGTDGSDGVMNAAGVSIDSRSLTRAEQQLDGDAQQYLDAANAGTFFAASGDLLVTGPTGTNVNDLVFGYRVS
jgi:hydroxypyruvate reductase